MVSYSLNNINTPTDHVRSIVHVGKHSLKQYAYYLLLQIRKKKSLCHGLWLSSTYSSCIGDRQTTDIPWTTNKR